MNTIELLDLNGAHLRTHTISATPTAFLIKNKVKSSCDDKGYLNFVTNDSALYQKTMRIQLDIDKSFSKKAVS